VVDLLHGLDEVEQDLLLLDGHWRKIHQRDQIQAMLRLVPLNYDFTVLRLRIQNVRQALILSAHVHLWKSGLRKLTVVEKAVLLRSEPRLAHNCRVLLTGRIHAGALLVLVAAAAIAAAVAAPMSAQVGRLPEIGLVLLAVVLGVLFGLEGVLVVEGWRALHAVEPVGVLLVLGLHLVLELGVAVQQIVLVLKPRVVYDRRRLFCHHVRCILVIGI